MTIILAQKIKNVSQIRAMFHATKKQTDGGLLIRKKQNLPAETKEISFSYPKRRRFLSRRNIRSFCKLCGSTSFRGIEGIQPRKER